MSAPDEQLRSPAQPLRDTAAGLGRCCRARRLRTASSRAATAAAEHLVGYSGDRLATSDYKKLLGRERVGLIGFCV